MSPVEAGREPEHSVEATIERRVEWHDTDAAGHQHNSVILRWAEEAEAALMRRYGLDWLFGRTPRVRHEVDYRGRLWFGTVARTRMWLVHLGRTSMRLGFEVAGPDGLAAEGVVVIVHSSPGSATAQPWPDEVRQALDTAREASPSASAASISA
jgi:acyl-CoA thioester hydrolase